MWTLMNTIMDSWDGISLQQSKKYQVSLVNTRVSVIHPQKSWPKKSITWENATCSYNRFKSQIDWLNHLDLQITFLPRIPLNQVHESHFLPTAVPICHAQQDPNEAPNTRRAWESWGVLCCLVLWMCSCLLRWTCLATSQNGSKAKTPTWQFQTYIWGNLWQLNLQLSHLPMDSEENKYFRLPSSPCSKQHSSSEVPQNM